MVILYMIADGAWNPVDRFVSDMVGRVLPTIPHDVAILNEHGIHVFELNDDLDPICEYTAGITANIGLVFDDEYQEMMFRLRYL